MKERGPIPKRRFKQTGMTDRKLQIPVSETFAQRLERSKQEADTEIAEWRKIIDEAKVKKPKP